MAKKVGRLTMLMRRLKTKVEAGEMTRDEAMAQIRSDPEFRRADAKNREPPRPREPKLAESKWGVVGRGVVNWWRR